MALVRGVVVLQALDHRVLSLLINLLGCPEHTAGRLLHKDGRDLALFGRNLEGSLVIDIDLVEELNITLLVDQHEADVGGLTGLEGNGHVLRFHNVLDLGHREKLTVVSVAFGIERCGLVGVRNVGTDNLASLNQLELVGQSHRGIFGNGLIEVPHKTLSGGAVAAEVVNGEGHLTASGEIVGSVCAVRRLNFSGAINNTVDSKLELVQVAGEVEVIVFAEANEVLHEGNNGFAHTLQLLNINRSEEVGSHLIVAVIVDQVEQHSGFILAGKLCHVIHEAVAELDAGSHAQISHVGRIILIAHGLTAQSLAGVTCIDHCLVGIVSLVLSALIVQSVLGVGTGTDGCSTGVGQIRNEPAEAAGSNPVCLQVGTVDSHVFVEPLLVFNIVIGEAVSVGIAVSLDPLLHIGPVGVEVILITGGNAIQAGMLAALRLPQVMAPIVVGMTVMVQLVDDGGGHAILVVEVVSTAGTDNIEELVFCRNILIGIQHGLGSQDIAVEVGGTCGHIDNGIQAILDNFFVVVSVDFRELHGNIVIVLHGNEAQLNAHIFLEEGLNQRIDGVHGVLLVGNACAQSNHDIHRLFALTVLDFAVDLQGNIHEILVVQLGGSLVNVADMHSLLGINRSFALCNANHVLCNFAAGSNAVTVEIGGFGSVEVNTLVQQLSAGHNDLHFGICFCLKVHGVVSSVIDVDIFHKVAVNIDIERHIVIFIRTVIQFHMEFDLILIQLGVGNVDLADNDLVIISLNGIQLEEEISQCVDALTDTVRDNILSRSAVSEVLDFLGEIMHIAAPSELLGGSSSLVVVVRVTAVLVGNSPDSCLRSRNQLRAIQLIRILKSGFLQILLSLLNGNIGVGVFEDRADLSCLLGSVILTVFQVQTLEINACFRGCCRVTAIDNIVIASACIVDSVRRPFAFICNGIHHGKQMHGTAAGLFLLDRVVAGFVIIVVFLGICGRLICGDHINITVFAGFDIHNYVITEPCGRPIRSKTDGTECCQTHQYRQECGETFFQFFCHVFIFLSSNFMEVK